MNQSPKSGSKPDKSNLKWRLRIIFLYYASYADRNNYKLLKTQNYRRFLIDSQAVQDQSGFPPYDIAFRKLHPSAVTLTQFQQLLPLIAHQLYSNKTRKQALQIFLHNHIQTLYHEILTKSEFGVQVSLVQSLVVQPKTIEMLQSIPLRKAYEKYVHNTSMHQKNPQQTFEQIHNFLTDFQMSPKLIYKALAYLIFFSLLRKKQDTRKYGLDDLKRLLVCVAELNWRKTQEAEGSQEQKVTRLLQYMELSQGFRKMVDQNLKENAIMVSFFKRHTARSQTEASYIHQKLERLGDSLQCPRQTFSQDNSTYFSYKPSRKEDTGTVKEILELNEGQQSAKRLRQIFAKLCSHGEVANTRTLKSIKIKKYFQSLNLMQPLSQTWLDIKIADVCRTSPSGKIQFPHFLQLLGLASKKLNIPSEGLFEYLIESDQGKKKGVGSGKRHQDVVITILCQIEKQLERMFNHYSTGKRCLTFDQLTHLLYDFDVFPAFLSKAHLYQLFQQYAKASSEVSKLMGAVSLDQQGFYKILASISQDVGEDLSPEQRIIFVLQKMQDSVGHRTLISGQSTNLIGDLRLRYANIYHLNALRRSRQKQQNFDQLIQDYDA